MAGDCKGNERDSEQEQEQDESKTTRENVNSSKA